MIAWPECSLVTLLCAPLHLAENPKNFVSKQFFLSKKDSFYSVTQISGSNTDVCAVTPIFYVAIQFYSLGDSSPLYSMYTIKE